MLLVMWNWDGFAQRDFVTKPLGAPGNRRRRCKDRSAVGERSR